MIGEDIASAGVNNDAGACAQPLLLLRQVEIATEEGIVVKRIGFGGSANVDDRRRDVLQDISGRGLSAADIADCGRAAGSGAGMRTSEANTPTYFDERVVIFGPELLSSSFGAGAGPRGQSHRSHDFGSCQTSTSSTNVAPIQAQCISYFTSLSKAHAPLGARTYHCSQKSMPAAGIGGSGTSVFGFSATMASVVISRPATEAASCSAVRTTLTGSITP